MLEDPAFAEKIRQQRKERSRTWRAKHPKESAKRCRDRYHRGDAAREAAREEKYKRKKAQEEERARQKEERRRARKILSLKTEYSRLKRASCKARAKQRGLEFSLSLSFLQSRIDSGVCEISGIPFDVSPPEKHGVRRWNCPSIDRIDSSKGYTEDNCRVILYCLNMAFADWGEDVFRGAVLAWLRKNPGQEKI